MMTVGTKFKKMWLQSVRTLVLLNATSNSSMASKSNRSPSFCRYSKEASCQILPTNHLFSTQKSRSNNQRLIPCLGNRHCMGDKSHLGDQVRVPYDGPDKEPVVRHFRAHFHLGCSQVQMHFVVGTGNGGEIKVSHSVQLQLESQSRLQVPVDPVLLKLGAPGAAQVEKGVREEGESS